MGMGWGWVVLGMERELCMIRLGYTLAGGKYSGINLGARVGNNICFCAWDFCVRCAVLILVFLNGPCVGCIRVDRLCVCLIAPLKSRYLMQWMEQEFYVGALPFITLTYERW